MLGFKQSRVLKRVITSLLRPRILEGFFERNFPAVVFFLIRKILPAKYYTRLSVLLWLASTEKKRFFFINNSKIAVLLSTNQSVSVGPDAIAHAPGRCVLESLF